MWLRFFDDAGVKSRTGAPRLARFIKLLPPRSLAAASEGFQINLQIDSTKDARAREITGMGGHGTSL